MPRVRRVLARRRLLALLGVGVALPAVTACRVRRRGDAGGSAASSAPAATQAAARQRLLEQVVTRERALLQTASAAASPAHPRAVLSECLRDHRAHLAALEPLLTAGVAVSGTPSPGVTSGPSGSSGATPAASARVPRTTPAALAAAESTWSADLLGLLPDAPGDLRALLASVAAAEASHAALLRDVA